MPGRQRNVLEPKPRRRPQIAPGELVGSSEAAALIGVKAKTFAAWKVRGKLPKPLVELRATPVWWKDDILAWDAERRNEDA